MTNTDTLRHRDLPTLASALNSQRTRAHDMVVPARSLTVAGGAFVMAGTEAAVIDENGVTPGDGLYHPTEVGIEGVADKLDIPVTYLRRLYVDHPDLYDANVNGWLARSDKSFLVRMLRDPQADTDRHGVCRAFLSDRYRTIDNFDVLLAALQGIQRSAVSAPEIQADLTDRRMYVRVTAPEVAVMAPELLAGYRSPWNGQTGADNPTVWAGFVITNSETGNGRFTITPRLVVQICTNGMTMTRDAMSQVHLGGQLDTGIVQWSEETQRRNLELVTSQTTDAVNAFLAPDYVQAKVTEMEKAAGVPVTDAPAVITTVSKRLGFTQDQANAILNAFISGGQLTAGGVMQAITAAAQTMADGDTAYAMEAAALPALELAAAASR